MSSFLERVFPSRQTLATLQSKVTSLEKELKLVGDGTNSYLVEEYESKFAKPSKSRILQYCEHSAIVQPIHNAIIREVTNAGWEIRPLFNYKCPNCEETFDEEPEGEDESTEGLCPYCQTPVIEPDPRQKKTLENFIDNPNPDHDLYEIIRSALKWVLAIDDYYISVSYIRKDKKGNFVIMETPQALYVENALFIEPHTGDDEYFCPICNFTGEKHTSTEPGICPTHKKELWKTAYTLTSGGRTERRYSKKEIIEGHFNLMLPNTKGTPILNACINQIEATMNLDLLKRDTFEKGTLAKIFAFEGYTQDEVNELQRSITSMAEKSRSKKSKIFNLFLGNSKGKVEIHDVLSDPSKLQELEWHRYYRDILLSNYGVTPVFAGTVESGKAGNNPMLQIDVMADTTKAWMKPIEEPFNVTLLPPLGITDWYFSFCEIESEDDEHKALLEKMKAETYAIYANAGYDVEISADGKFKPTKAERIVYEEEVPDDFLNFFQFGKKKGLEKSWHDYIPDKLLDDIMAALESISNKYGKNIQDIITSQSQSLDRSKLTREIEAEIMDSAKAFDATLKHYLFPIFQEGYLKIFREYNKKLSKADLDPYALAYLQEYFDGYDTPFMKTWTTKEKQKIFEIIEEEALEGYNWTKVRKRLSEYFEVRNSYYWRMVARTEGTRAFINSGNAAAKELGASEKRVIFRDDDVGCEDCADAAGRGWHGLNESIPEGDIPFHPHCRCYYEYRTQEMKEEGYGGA